MRRFTSHIPKQSNAMRATRKTDANASMVMGVPSKNPEAVRNLKDRAVQVASVNEVQSEISTTAILKSARFTSLLLAPSWARIIRSVPQEGGAAAAMA
jgi:hypothetical protein